MNTPIPIHSRKFPSWKFIPLTCVSLCMGVNAVHADQTYIVVHDGETVEAIKGETYTQGWIALRGGTITGQNNIVYGRNQSSQGINNDYAIGVEHNGGSITIEGVDGVRAKIISSTTAGGKGVQVAGTGTFHAINTDISSKGVGVRSEGGGTTDIDLDNVTIATTDTNSAYGVLLDYGSYAHLKDCTITTKGSGILSYSNRGLYTSNGSRMDLSGNINVTTSGSGSAGIYAFYEDGSGNTLVVADATSNLVIRTAGGAAINSTYSHGIEARQNTGSANLARVELNGLIDVKTTGSGSNGLRAMGVNASILYTGDQDGGIVRAEGSSAVGIEATGGGRVEVTNLAVQSKQNNAVKVTGNSTVIATDSILTTETGTNAVGVSMSTSAANQEATFTMSGGSLNSAQHAFAFTGGSANSKITVDIENAVVTPGAGKYLLNTAVATVTSADFNVDNSTLQGSIYTQQGSVVRSDMNDVDWSYVGKSTLTEYSLTGNSILGMTITTVDNYDYINASLAMMMDGTITINMHIAENVDNLTEGREFWIFRTAGDIDNSTATYVWNPDITLNEGLYWDTSRLYAEGIVEIKANPVPEPGTATLSLLALSALIMRRRRA